MSRLKVEMCKAAVFTSSVFHILSFPYRPQSHSWGARSLTFFYFRFPPLKHSVLHLSLLSQQLSSLLLNTEGQLPFLSVGDFPTALFRHGVWGGVGAPICYWKPAWNLFFISAAFNCVYAYYSIHTVAIAKCYFNGYVINKMSDHAAPWWFTVTKANINGKNMLNNDQKQGSVSFVVIHVILMSN